MKQDSLSILFFVLKGRLLKNGEAPIILRVTLNGSEDQVRVLRSVPLQLWNRAKGRSTGKDAASSVRNMKSSNKNEVSISQARQKKCCYYKKIVKRHLNDIKESIKSSLRFIAFTCFMVDFPHSAPYLRYGSVPAQRCPHRND